MFKLFLCLIIVLCLAAEVLSTVNNLTESEAEVEALLRSLSLEAKIGQMVQLDIALFVRPGTASVDYDKLKEYITAYEVGSVLNSPFSGGPVDGRSGWSAAEWRALIQQIQEYATTLTTGKVPVIYGLDSIHGATYVEDAVLFPQAINLGAAFNPSLAYAMGEITSRDTRAAGIPWIFAPVLGLGLQPAWARFPETFGEDAHVAATLGAAVIRGLQAEKDDNALPRMTAACMKHFIAYSLPHNGHDRAPVMLPDRVMKQLYRPSFQAAIDSGVLTAMESYQEVGGVPMVSSREYLHTLLRKQMKFRDGFMVTDYQEIENLHSFHKVSANVKEAVLRAMTETTIDMSMVPFDNSFFESLKELVQEGKVPESRIDDSVRRILRVKQRLGLLQSPVIPLDEPVLTQAVGQHSDWEASLSAARESLTLVKNDDRLLPLSDSDKSLRVLLTGPTADSAASQTGGWSLHWQGAMDESEFSRRETVLSAFADKRLFGGVLRYSKGPALDAADLSGLDMDAVLTAANESDVIVVCVGEDTYAEKPGDIDDLSLPAGQVQYVTQLAKTGKPVILVAIEGRPRLMHDAVTASQAVLLAYQPGPLGGRAIVEALLGKFSPSGRLPFTFPRSPQNSVYPYHRKPSDQCVRPTGPHSAAYTPCDVEFAFGEGLSYTSFEYSDLLVKAYKPSNTAESGVLARSDEGQPLIVDEEALLRVSVTVRNTGGRAAKHTVLLFLYDLYRVVSPEYKLLKRFQKVDLSPGESKTIVFDDLTAKDLQFIGVEGEYILEGGDFRLGVGAQTDCRSDARESDWFLTAPDTSSSSPMCTEFSLALSPQYNAVCDEACGMWQEGVCGASIDAAQCRETCVRQQWTWDYAHCVLGYYGERCADVREMQCFDAFGYTSSAYVSAVSEAVSESVSETADIDRSDDASLLIVGIALATSFAGVLLGFVAAYWYFSKHMLPSEEQLRSKRETEIEDAFAYEALLSNQKMEESL